MSRYPMITQKVQTQFGSLYVHVIFDKTGDKPVAIRFSSPGKFADTTMGAVLDALGTATTKILGGEE